jgi:Glyoxalase-like domain
MPPVRKIQVTFDCAEPQRVARFWAEVLGYLVDDDGEACSDPAGVGPRLYFQKVPEGKVVKNRVHLDMRVGTGLVGEERLAALEAECARLIPLGATRLYLLPADDENESCLVMQDVEGNEFCLD